jgi:hypothetical protein
LSLFNSLCRLYQFYDNYIFIRKVVFYKTWIVENAAFYCSAALGVAAMFNA